MAERVAKQPGWRFELIALRTSDAGLQPDLPFAGESVKRLIDEGFLKPAFIVTCAVIENIIAHWGANQKRRPIDLSPAEALKQLLVEGIINERTYDGVRRARARRNALMHDPAEAEPARVEIEALMQLGSTLKHNVSSKT